jgi:CubicO group peptidase (beta-lactamase class C family)
MWLHKRKPLVRQKPIDVEPTRRLVIMLMSTMALTLYVSGSAARSDAIQHLDDYVRAQMVERHIPGMGLAVIRNGRIDKIGAYGHADLSFNVKVLPTTLFSVASTTKTFTAVAIMMLVEAGKLRLDDGIGQYLEGLPPLWRDVPIRRLLNHTSGLPDDAVDQYTTNTIADTPDGVLQLLRDRPMDFVPGTASRYNQTNFLLLGRLIEKLSGQSFTQFCAERMFKPLNLQGPAFGDSRMVIRNRATVYTPYRFGTGTPVLLDHAEVLHYEFAPFTYPHDGLNISILDFATWLNALLNGKVISRSSLEEIWTPAKLNDGSIPQRPPSPTLWRSYGLGWVVAPDNSHPLAGGTGGLRAAFFAYPNDNIAVIVLTNAQGSGPEQLADSIARRYFR